MDTDLSRGLDLIVVQACTQGEFGGFGRTSLLKFSIHMNLYCVYVGHTHSFSQKKNPPMLKLGMGLW